MQGFEIETVWNAWLKSIQLICISINNQRAVQVLKLGLVFVFFISPFLNENIVISSPPSLSSLQLILYTSLLIFLQFVTSFKIVINLLIVIASYISSKIFKYILLSLFPVTCVFMIQIINQEVCPWGRLFFQISEFLRWLELFVQGCVCMYKGHVRFLHSCFKLTVQQG